MKASELVPLEPRCEWQRDALGDSYVFQLTDAHLDELDRALVHAEASCDDVLDITREAFPLPTLGPALIDVARELGLGADQLVVDRDRIGDEARAAARTGVEAEQPDEVGAVGVEREREAADLVAA